LPPFVGTQAPSEHCTWPPGQLDAHVSFAHTWPLPHIVLQAPQWVASDATQVLPHESSPALQRHCPPWHVCPTAQALPHEPQFC
jgi:hypothetical protein